MQHVNVTLKMYVEVRNNKGGKTCENKFNQ